MLKISVVVPCLNAAPVLARQLEALANQTSPPLEVIVADNGSTDDSAAIARRMSNRLPGFRWVDASARRGAAHARNAGARAATGDAIAFCDADDEVAPGWIDGLQRALQVAEFVASRFDMTRLNPGNRYVHPQTSGLIQESAFDFLPRAGGCGLAVRREVHERVGGFDESVRFHEDTDYCWRIQLSGSPLEWAGDAVMHVQLPQNPGDRFRKARQWGAGEARLYVRYRANGMPRPSILAALKAWLDLARIAARVAIGRASREHLVWQLGTRIGRIEGSIQYHALYL